eukprot:11958995-Alexandrium_andersonii.AAC.1
MACTHMHTHTNTARLPPQRSSDPPGRGELQEEAPLVGEKGIERLCGCAAMQTKGRPNTDERINEGLCAKRALPPRFQGVGGEGRLARSGGQASRWHA